MGLSQVIRLEKAEPAPDQGAGTESQVFCVLFYYSILDSGKSSETQRSEFN